MWVEGGQLVGVGGATGRKLVGGGGARGGLHLVEKLACLVALLSTCILTGFYHFLTVFNISIKSA